MKTETIRVLYVDDETGLLEIGKLYLEATAGFVIDTLTSATEALTIIREQHYDAIVSDYQMPEMDGIAFLKAVRSSGNTIPFVLFTGRGREEVVIQALNEGADIYLQKGGDPRPQFVELAHKIRLVVRQRRAEAQLQENREFLESAMDLARIARWELDVKTGMFTFNDRLYALFGTTVESEGGYVMSVDVYTREFVHPEDAHLVGEEFRRIQSVHDPEFHRELEHRVIRRDGEIRTIIVRYTIKLDSSGNVILTHGANQDITDRKRMEEALEKRILALTQPLESDTHITFEDLFNLDDIQRLQDEFAAATGVASIITHPDGTPITRPSGFCRLCRDIIRNTEKGLRNCYRSDAALGHLSTNGPVIQPCMSGGLWDAGAGISVGGRQIANWLIGQVRDETQTEDGMRAYAREIGADEEEVIAAFMEVPVMSQERFRKISQSLFTFANQLSTLAYQNVQQARFIADRRQAEDALRKSEEKYRVLFDNAILGIFRSTPEGRYLDMNPAFARLLGYSSPAEMIASVIDIGTLYVNPEERDRFTTEIAQNGEVRNFEAEIRHTNGSVIWVAMNARAFRDETGRILWYDGTIEDITDRKGAEQEIRAANEQIAASEEELRANYAELANSEQRIRENERALFTLLGNLSGMAYRCRNDAMWTMEFVSEGCLELTGYSPSDLIGNAVISYADCILPEDQQYVWDEVQKALHERGKFQIIYRIRTKDGIKKWVWERGIGIFSPENKLISIEGFISDITDQKRAEEELVKKSEELDQFFSASLDLFCIADMDGYFLRLNKEWEKTLGYSLADLEGKRFLDFVHPDDMQATLAAIADLSAQKQVLNFTNRYLCRDGTYKWIEWRSLPKGDRIYAAARDITGRKNAEETFRKNEEALREGEAQLRSILTGSPILQFVIGRDHHVISWNKALEEYSGVRAADIIGTDNQWMAFYPKKRPVLADLILDNDQDRIEELYKGKIHRSRFVEGAFEAVDFFPAMGTSGIWLAFTAAPVRDAHGDIIGAIETLEDITERKRAEEALRTSEEKFAKTFQSTPDLILLSSIPDTRILDVNAGVLPIIGYTREEVLGKNVTDLNLWAEESVRVEYRNLVQKEGSVLNYEADFRKKDGTIINGLISGTIITLESGPCFITVVRDITERKRMEEAIRKTDAVLRLANKKLSLLSSITRHDIRNQLTVLKGLLELSEMAFQDKEKLSAYLEREKKIADIIERQIIFTRVYEDLGMNSPVWQKVSDCVDSAVTSLPMRSVRVDLVTPGIEVFADPLFEKVFYNLIDNALRYGGDTMTRIRISSRDEDGVLTITVENDGEGISPGDKERLFTKGFGKNTGLGLFLSREILEITGITITENGEPGKGARFEIVVPEGGWRSVSG